MMVNMLIAVKIESKALLEDVAELIHQKVSVKRRKETLNSTVRRDTNNKYQTGLKCNLVLARYLEFFFSCYMCYEQNASEFDFSKNRVFLCIIAPKSMITTIV